MFFIFFIKEKIRKAREERQQFIDDMRAVGKKIMKNMTPQEISKMRRDLEEAKKECNFIIPVMLCLLIIWIAFGVTFFQTTYH